MQLIFQVALHLTVDVADLAAIVAFAAYAAVLAWFAVVVPSEKADFDIVSALIDIASVAVETEIPVAVVADV